MASKDVVNTRNQLILFDCRRDDKALKQKRELFPSILLFAVERDALSASRFGEHPLVPEVRLSSELAESIWPLNHIHQLSVDRLVTAFQDLIKNTKDIC